MPKYAREVDHGTELRLIDVVTTPDPLPEWAETPTDFIAKMFPSIEGFKEVPDSVEAGAKVNEDGTLTNPEPVSVPEQKPEPSKAELLAKVEELLQAVSELK